MAVRGDVARGADGRTGSPVVVAGGDAGGAAVGCAFGGADVGAAGWAFTGAGSGTTGCAFTGAGSGRADEGNRGAISPSFGGGGVVNLGARSVGDCAAGVVGTVVDAREGPVDGDAVGGAVAGGVVAGGSVAGCLAAFAGVVGRSTVVGGGVTAGREASFGSAGDRAAAVASAVVVAARRSAGDFGAEGASSVIRSDKPTNPTATAAPPYNSSVLSGGPPVRLPGRE